MVLAVYISAKAQTARHPFQLVDRFCECQEFTWTYDQFVLNNIKLSKNDMEIRITETIPRQVQTIILIFRREGRYEGAIYHKKLTNVFYADSLKKYGKWEKYPYKKILLTSLNLDSVVRELEHHRVFSLPDQNKVYHKSFYGHYVLETKLNGAFTTATFGVPLDGDDYRKPELSDYNAIRALFNSIRKTYIQ